MEHGLIGFLLVAAALVLIFGGRKKLEDLGAGLGGFMREFNKARQDSVAPTETSKAETKKRKAKAKKTVARKKL